MMTVQELLDALATLDPATEVRLAEQPSWPFEYSLAGVLVSDRLPAEDDADDLPLGESPEPVLYLVEGTQLAYLPGSVSGALGWR
jgi:hypothetical protein